MCNMKLPSNNPMKLKASAAKVKPSPRPYTTYNIFFQLEREYILQHELHVIPTLAPQDIFQCSDNKYEGPLLPPKYQKLTLPHDWFIPGKALRKKRQHRASHGKISFTDLSKQIASSWHNCDGPVKLFCAQVSDIGMMKYKHVVYQHKKLDNNIRPVVSKNSSSSKPKISPTKPKTAALPSTEQFVATFTCASTVSPETIRPAVSSSLSSLPGLPGLELSSLPIELSAFLIDICAEQPRGRGVVLSPPPSSIGFVVPPSLTIGGMVDMQDDEIFRLWNLEI